MNANLPHVGFFLPSLAGGGAERAFVTIAGLFARSGYACDLVAANAQGIFRGEVEESVHLVDLRTRRVLAALPGLAAYLRRTRPDVLIAGQTHANLVALWAGRLAGYRGKIVVTEHHALRALNEPGLNRRERLLLPLVRAFYSRADALVGVSGGVADDLAAVAHVDRVRVRVIYNPIVTAKLLARSQEQPRHTWLLDGGAPVILSAGRLVEAKDFETLLRAFARATAQEPCRLLILGEGPERARLEALAEALRIADKVAMPGFEPNPYAAMRCAQVYASSSRREGLPSAIVEALACGLPVVATDCPHGVAEVLDQGRYGRLVRVGDADALADGILAALREPRDPAAGMRRAQDFSEESALAAYQKLIEELLR